MLSYRLKTQKVKPRKLKNIKRKDNGYINLCAHLVTRRYGDVIATSFCTYHQLRLVESFPDVTVICLHDIILERRDNV